MSRRYSGNDYRQEPLRGRRLWRYGDWGSAGEHIGRHWEAVGTPVLAAALGRVRPPLWAGDSAYRPRLLVSIVADPALAEQVHSAGLAHADTFLLGYGTGGQVVAEPVDFKWSLETSEARQVSGTGLATLLNARLSHLDMALSKALDDLEALGPHPEDTAWGTVDFAALRAEAATRLAAAEEAQAAEAAQRNASSNDGDDPGEAPPGASRPPPATTRDAVGPWGIVRCRDGVFFAPHNTANLTFLRGEFNGRKNEPLGADQAWFEEVDGPTFFSPLSGWDISQLLAGYDRSTAMLATIDGAERYYRLGAGTLGALTRWHSSIFSAAPANIDGPADLEALRRNNRLWNSTDISLYLDRMMNVRAQRDGALRDWLKELYGWGRFRGDLGRQGVPPSALDSKGGKRRWGSVFSQISKALEAQVKAEGLAFVTQPMSDMEALEELQKRTTDLQNLAGTLAGQLIGDELAGRRPVK